MRNRNFSHSASKALRALGHDVISPLDSLRAIQHGGCQAVLSRCGSTRVVLNCRGRRGISSHAGPASAAATPGAAAATEASAADAAAISARYSAMAAFFLLAECSCQSSGEIVGGLVDPFLVLTPPRPLKVSRPIPRVSMPVGSLVFVGGGPASAVASPTGGAGSLEGVDGVGYAKLIVA